MISRKEWITSWTTAFQEDNVEQKLDAVAQMVDAVDQTRRVYALLQQGLHDADVIVAVACLDAIQRLFAEEWEPAVWCLWQNPSESHRLYASEILATNLGQRGVDALFSKLNAIDYAMYPQAWQTLVRYHADALLEYTLRWTHHPQWAERYTAVQSMISLPHQGWKEQHHKDAVKQRCVRRLLELSADPEEQVRCVVLRVLGVMERSLGISVAKKALTDRDSSVRLAALELLELCNEASLFSAMWKLRQDDHGDVRAKVLSLCVQWRPTEECLPTVRAGTQDESETVRLVAVKALGQFGGSDDLDLLTGMFGSDSVELADAVIDAICQLSQGSTRSEALAKGLIHSSEDILVRIVEILCDTMSAESWAADMPNHWMSILPKTRGYAAKYGLSQLKTNWPSVWKTQMAADNVSNFPWPTDEFARQQVLWFFSEQLDDMAVLLFEHAVRDDSPLVRAEALRLLGLRDVEKARMYGRQALSDTAPGVKLVAMQHVSQIRESWVVDALLPKTRDVEPVVRKSAIEALVPFDDPRIVAEWVSSLQDVDPAVRITARCLLEAREKQEPSSHGQDRDRHEQNTPVTPSFGATLSKKRCVSWQTLVAKADEIRRWASDIGQQLLGRAVRIHQHRHGLGYTVYAEGDGPIDIYVSDTPVTSGSLYGEEVMKGLALHEIGHHLFDIGVRGFSTMQGIARSEGIKDIFDILIDERMERGLRSRRPAWGVYLDRLASYAFAQNEHQIPLFEYAALLGWEKEAVLAAIQHKELPGRLMATKLGDDAVRVRLRDVDLLAIPKAIPPLYAFLWCFRCGLDATLYHDACVSRAIALVPSYLKHLDHADLLSLSRAISVHLGTGPQNQQAMAQTRGILRGCPHLDGMWGKIERGLGEAQRTLLGMWQEPGGIRHSAISESHEPLKRSERTQRGGRTINLGKDMDFPAIQREEMLSPDVHAYTQRLVPIRKQIRNMRDFFERLGRRTLEIHASRRGRRLDMARVRSLVLLHQPNALVQTEEEMSPDLYVGLLIDRSGSMAGGRMALAQSFAALLVESTRGLRGITGHVHAFDDTTLYRLGDLHQYGLASLEAMGGNNDAGALQRAAELALQSRKHRCLLIMISDGMPTECTVGSLQKLVRYLTEQMRMICVQVAVEPISHPCFPHYLDVSQYPLEEAVSRFGRLLIKLTSV